MEEWHYSGSSLWSVKAAHSGPSPSCIRRWYMFLRACGSDDGEDICGANVTRPGAAVARRLLLIAAVLAVVEDDRAARPRGGRRGDDDGLQVLCCGGKAVAPFSLRQPHRPRPPSRGQTRPARRRIGALGGGTPAARRTARRTPSCPSAPYFSLRGHGRLGPAKRPRSPQRTEPFHGLSCKLYGFSLVHENHFSVASRRDDLVHFYPQLMLLSFRTSKSVARK